MRVYTEDGGAKTAFMLCPGEASQSLVLRIMLATWPQVDCTLVALLLLITLVAVAGAACGCMRAAVVRPPSAFDGVAVAKPAWVYHRRSLGHATADLVAHDGAEKGDLASVKAPSLTRRHVPEPGYAVPSLQMPITDVTAVDENDPRRSQ